MDPLTSSAAAGASVPTPTYPVTAFTVSPPVAPRPVVPRTRSPAVVVRAPQLLPPGAAHALGPLSVSASVPAVPPALSALRKTRLDMPSP